MPSDIISYAVLASVFIVIGLRMFVDKPGKPSELPFLRAASKPVEEIGLRESSES
jgi:hypothetical protein